MDGRHEDLAGQHGRSFELAGSVRGESPPQLVLDGAGLLIAPCHLLAQLLRKLQDVV